MRFGIVCGEDAATVEQLRARVDALSAAGVALIWLRQGRGLPDPFVQAAAAGPLSHGLRIGVEVELGDAHPIEVAEQAAVADQASNGRLVLGLRPAAGTEADLAEAVGLVLASHRSRPFRHAGPRWPTPANLASNTHNPECRIRVTPAPAQLEIPTWIVGSEPVAVAHALPLLARSSAAAASHWGARDDGPLGDRIVRPMEIEVDAPDGEFDHRDLVAALRDAQAAWGCDTVLVNLPQAPAAWQRALDRLARLVAPRLQLDRLPSGLTEFWDEQHD